MSIIRILHIHSSRYLCIFPTVLKENASFQNINILAPPLLPAICLFCSATPRKTRLMRFSLFSFADAKNASPRPYGKRKSHLACSE